MRKTALALVLVLVTTTVYAAKSQPDAVVPSADEYTVLAGKVTIGTIDSHTIAVLVNDGGSYRHLFRLWTETPVKTFRATSENASVEFRGDELVVMASEEDWFYALVTSGNVHAPRQPSGYTGARYVGYGLNHEIRPVATQMDRKGRRIVALDFCDDFDNCVFNVDYGSGGGGGGSCDSGGLGATACSTSNSRGSCSVSCISNTYACCTNATATSGANCRCIVY